MLATTDEDPVDIDALLEMIERSPRGNPQVLVASGAQNRTVFHIDPGCRYAPSSPRRWNLETCRRTEIAGCRDCVAPPLASQSTSSCQ